VISFPQPKEKAAEKGKIMKQNASVTTGRRTKKKKGREMGVEVGVKKNKFKDLGIIFFKKGTRGLNQGGVS